MTNTLVSRSTLRGMTLLFPHTTENYAVLARIEICQGASCKDKYFVFVKSFLSAKGDKISDVILNREDLHKLPQTAKDISRDLYAVEDSLKDAVVQTIMIETMMLERGWQVFNRKWAQEKEGIEMLARGFGVIRLLPSTPNSQSQYVFPVKGLGN